MLDSTQIKLNALLIWVGYTIGGLLLILRAVTGTEYLSSFGLAVVIVTSAWAVRSSVAVRDDTLRETFEYGRRHEREATMRALR